MRLPLKMWKEFLNIVKTTGSNSLQSGGGERANMDRLRRRGGCWCVCLWSPREVGCRREGLRTLIRLSGSQPKGMVLYLSLKRSINFLLMYFCLVCQGVFFNPPRSICKDVTTLWNGVWGLSQWEVVSLDSALMKRLASIYRADSWLTDCETILVLALIRVGGGGDISVVLYRRVR